jgi:hypothetical protein
MRSWRLGALFPFVAPEPSLKHGRGSGRPGREFSPMRGGRKPSRPRTPEPKPTHFATVANQDDAFSSKPAPSAVPELDDDLATGPSYARGGLVAMAECKGIAHVTPDRNVEPAIALASGAVLSQLPVRSWAARCMHRSPRLRRPVSTMAEDYVFRWCHAAMCRGQLPTGRGNAASIRPWPSGKAQLQSQSAMPVWRGASHASAFVECRHLQIVPAPWSTQVRCGSSKSFRSRE